MQTLYQSVAEEFAELGLKAFTVNMDGPPSQNKVRPFMRRHRLTLPVILDKANQLAKQFHFTALPATAIISGSGEVVYKHVGYNPGDERVLRERVAELVGASGHSKAVKKEGAK